MPLESYLPDSLTDLTLISAITRLLLALVLGGVLGLERGRKRRPAGLRTYMIVCMASTLIMLTDVFLYDTYHTGDPARLGAQVVSGIGFLGAGSIIITGRQVKGITTAAGLWAAAGMGLALGAGFYFGAILTGILLLIVMTLMSKLDYYMYQHSRNVNIFAEFKSMEHFTDFIKQVRVLGYTVADIELKKSQRDEDYVGADLLITITPPCNHAELVQQLSEIKGVKYIEEVEGT